MVAHKHGMGRDIHQRGSGEAKDASLSWQNAVRSNLPRVVCCTGIATKPMASAVFVFTRDCLRAGNRGENSIALDIFRESPSV